MPPIWKNWSKLLLIVTSAMFWSWGVYANETPKTSKVKAKAKSKVQVTQPDGENNDANATASQTEGTKSTDFRKSQVANVDLLYTPLSDFVLSYGGSASYNVKPDFALGLHYLTGSKTVHYESTDSVSTVKSDANLKGSAGYVYGRYFFGNSFNMLAGLGIRTATVNYTIDDSSLNLKLNGKIDIQSITVPVFIGNRWTFKSGFTIGCDWIGAFIPLGGKAKSTLSGNLPNALITDLNDKFVKLGDDLAHKTSLTLLLTSIGWAF